MSGWDSMAHVNLVLAIEQHFDVQFKPEEMLEMLSIELTAMLVEEKLAARGTRLGAEDRRLPDLRRT